MELLFTEIPEHRLAAIPVQPLGTKVEQQQQTAAKQAQSAEQPGEAAGMDRPARLCGRQAYRFAWINAGDDRGGNSFGHFMRPIRHSGRADDRAEQECITESDSEQKCGSDAERIASCCDRSA